MSRDGEPAKVRSGPLLASGAGALFLFGLVVYPACESWLQKRRAAALTSEFGALRAELEERRQSAEPLDPRRRAHRESRAAVVTDGPEYLEVVTGDVDEQRVALGAELAFELDGGVRAFATRREASLDWFVVFYRESGEGGHRRFGPVFGPEGFGSPYVTGLPRRLHLEPRDGDEPFVFQVYDETVRFAPAYECIEGCDESEVSQPSTVFIEPDDPVDAPRGLRR